MLTRSDRSPGPLNRFSCIDLENFLRKQTNKPTKGSNANICGPMGAEANKSMVFIRIFLRDRLYLDTPYGIQCQNADTTLGTYAIEFKSGLAIYR